MKDKGPSLSCAGTAHTVLESISARREAMAGTNDEKVECGPGGSSVSDQLYKYVIHLTLGPAGQLGDAL